MTKTTFGLIICTLAACDYEASGDTADTGFPAGDTDAPAGGGNGGAGGAQEEEPPTWTTLFGPCTGYRTETLVFADDGSAWAGCGADVGGYYAASPGMWESVLAFSSFHLYDLHLADNGLLYAAGDDTASIAIAYVADPATGARVPTDVLHVYDGTIDGIPLAGNIVRRPDGLIHVDGQNGNAYAVSTDDGVSFDSLYFANHQRMDVDLGNDGQLYASGATISQPPTIFFPTADGRSWLPLELTGYTGELFGIEAIDGDHLVAVGVDEPTHAGLLVRCLDGGCTQAAAWTQDHLATSPLIGAPAYAGRLWAVHFDATGTFGMAVGEQYPQSLGGYAIYTTDGGRTWAEAENPGFPILTEVWSFGDGRFAVAGGGGYLALSVPLQ